MHRLSTNKEESWRQITHLKRAEEKARTGTLSFHPKLLRPQLIPSGAPLISGLEAVLDHLIHLREPDPKDLRQDLPGRIQLHSPPVLHCGLLRPE